MPLLAHELDVQSVLQGQVRPKEKYALFPVTCPKLLGSVGRQSFFFIKTFFVWKKYEILKNSLKIDFDIPKGFKKSLSRPQNIRVGRVTGNKTFSFFGLSLVAVNKIKSFMRL